MASIVHHCNLAKRNLNVCIAKIDQHLGENQEGIIMIARLNRVHTVLSEVETTTNRTLNPPIPSGSVWISFGICRAVQDPVRPASFSIELINFVNLMEEINTAKDSFMQIVDALPEREVGQSIKHCYLNALATAFRIITNFRLAHRITV